MKTRTTIDKEKHVSQITIFSYDPRSSIWVLYKDGRIEEVPHKNIKKFIEFAESREAIDEHLASGVRSDFPHLFLPQPSQSHLESLYQQMHASLIQALINAEKKGKKLLIFAGEGHDNSSSLMLQTMLLYILNEAKINNLLIEASPSLLTKLAYHPRMVKKLNAEYSVPLAANELRMNIIAADLDVSEKNYLNIRQREAVMVSKCLDTNDNCCFIIGSGHLKNLMSNKVLNDKYHILGLNISCITEEQLEFEISKAQSLEERESLIFPSSSEKVIQIELAGNVDSLEPKEILASAANIHYKKSRKEDSLLASLNEKLETHAFTKQPSAFFTSDPITSNTVTPALQNALKNGGVEKYIKKGHAKLEQLIELQNEKPWVIDALRCHNVRQGIYNKNIDIDQLSKLTEEQIHSIEHNIYGKFLEEKVQEYIRLNQIRL